STVYRQAPSNTQITSRGQMLNDSGQMLNEYDLLAKERLPDDFLKARMAYQTKLANAATTLSGSKDAYYLIKNGVEEKLFVTQYDLDRAKNLVEKYERLQKNPKMAQWLENLKTIALDPKSKDDATKA